MAKKRKARARKTKSGRGRRRTGKSPPDIWIVHSGTSGKDHHLNHIKAFQEGLKLYNVNIPGSHYQYAGGTQGLDKAFQDLVAAGVRLIVAAGGSACAEAAMRATTNIPIIVTSAHYTSRPADNVAGVGCRTTDLDGTRLGKLIELLPKTKTVGVLYNPTRSDTQVQQNAIKTAASLQNIDPNDVNFQSVSDVGQINAAFKNLKGYDAVLIAADPLFNENIDVVLESGEDIPAIYQWREFADAGGLISYGPNLSRAYMLAGTLVGRNVNGERISRLPYLSLQAAELVINLKKAKNLKIDVPPTLLVEADDVIVHD